MINVALLLLVFFLMTAVIAPPPPFEVQAPFAASDEGSEGAEVFVRTDGSLIQRDGAPVVIADVQGRAVVLYANADLAAALVARVARDLMDLGATNVALSATAR